MGRLSEQAIAELRAGVARAKSIPTGFDMCEWSQDFEDALARAEDEAGQELDVTEPPCGTVGCLAFEIEAAERERRGLEVSPEAMEEWWAYGNPEAQFATAWKLPQDNIRELFFEREWPDDLRTAYQASPPFSAERVDVLEQAVERWIAGDGSFNK